jgi:hypothetical protein
VNIVVIVLNVVSILSSNHITFMWGISRSIRFLPNGLKSSQGRHLLNMRLALAARIPDHPARDSTFMCVNPTRSGEGSASLKK